MNTILIADAQQIIRLGIRALLENRSGKFTIIEAATCKEVIEILSSQKVHYIIIEMFLADGYIFSSIFGFMHLVSGAGVLVHSLNENIYARRLMQMGIQGFISKRNTVQELEIAIDCLLKGESYLSAALKEELFKPGKQDMYSNPIDTLSDRELEVLEYTVAGKGPTEIAEKMKLDVTTISTYRRRALDKLAVRNVFELKEKFLLYKMQE